MCSRNSYLTGQMPRNRQAPPTLDSEISCETAAVNRSGIEDVANCVVRQAVCEGEAEPRRHCMTTCGVTQHHRQRLIIDEGFTQRRNSCIAVDTSCGGSPLNRGVAPKEVTYKLARRSRSDYSNLSAQRCVISLSRLAITIGHKICHGTASENDWLIIFECTSESRARRESRRSERERIRE
jgi:hypothetical protein